VLYRINLLGLLDPDEHGTTTLRNTGNYPPSDLAHNLNIFSNTAERTSSFATAFYSSEPALRTNLAQSGLKIRDI